MARVRVREETVSGLNMAQRRRENRVASVFSPGRTQHFVEDISFPGRRSDNGFKSLPILRTLAERLKC